jgi:putative SOS response-associated peptidase YedK
MCGRYALSATAAQLIEHFQLLSCPEYGARYNIAPQSHIPIIRYKADVGRVGQLVKWGLIPSWSKDPNIGNKLNNARSETVAEKPSFRSSFARHRCLIPANGFYEWKAISVDGKVRKQPYYIHPTNPEGFFAFAGLLAAWKPPECDTVVSTCIITTGPNEVMAPIHDRMPVILQRGQFDAWLDPSNNNIEALKTMLLPFQSDQMDAYPVSTSINRGNVDGPACIEPIETQ